MLACFLAWVGEADFETPMQALQHIAEVKRISMERLTIPSQRRYIQYFTNVMDGVKPRSDPLVLRRMIINTVPSYSTGEDGTGGCRPYIQIFKNGKLLFTSTWRNAQDGTDIKSYYPSDGSFAFQIDCVVQGDVLIRCRHLSETGERVSMFRAAFHTGYIPCGIQRLTKAQMDGACHDDRFQQDFFVDLIFSPMDAHGGDGEGGSGGSGAGGGGGGGGAEGASSGAEVTDAGLSITGKDQEAYRAMVEHSSSFWDEIAKRKVRIHRKRAMRAARLARAQREKEEAEAAAAANEASGASGGGGGGGGGSTPGGGAGSAGTGAGGAAGAGASGAACKSAGGGRRDSAATDDGEGMIGGDDSPTPSSKSRRRRPDASTFSIVCGDDDDVTHGAPRDGFMVDELLKDQLQSMGMSSGAGTDAGGDAGKVGTAATTAAAAAAAAAGGTRGAGGAGGAGGANSAEGAAAKKSTTAASTHAAATKHVAATPGSSTVAAGTGATGATGAPAALQPTAATSAAPPVPAASGANDELEQLAQLEKELGLESLSDELRTIDAGAGTAGAAAGAGAASATAVAAAEDPAGGSGAADDDIDLDDLGLDGIEGLEDFDFGDAGDAGDGTADVDVDASMAEIDDFLKGMS